MKFPRQEQNETGWVVSTEYLNQIADRLNQQAHEDFLTDQGYMK